MVMSWIWTGMVAVSFLAAAFLGNGAALSAAIPKGAQEGFLLAVSLAGSICLWTGVGKLMEHAGLTGMLSKLLRPLLGRLFPSVKKDAHLENCLSANVCANFLGLGNAATPMGIQAAKRLAQGQNGIASNELCLCSFDPIPCNLSQRGYYAEHIDIQVSGSLARLFQLRFSLRKCHVSRQYAAIEYLKGLDSKNSSVKHIF